MQDNILAAESKKLAWHRPLLVEVRYPKQFKLVEDRQNWICAMLADPRVGDRTKVVLTRLAHHLNLKTGRCDPSIRLLALELSFSPDNEKSGRRMVQRCLEEAEQLGWVKRTHRSGGNRLNQSNSYKLTCPDIWAEIEGAGATVQSCRGDSTVAPGRLQSHPEQGSITGNIEHSVLLRKTGSPEVSRLEDPLSSSSPSFPSSPAERDGGPQGAAETGVARPRPPIAAAEPVFTPDDVEYLRDLILQEVGTFPRTMKISWIVAMCRQPGAYEYPIDGRQIGAMVKAGHFGRIDNSVYVKADN